MVPNNTNDQAKSTILEAFGEVTIANFSQAQLEDVNLVSRWFQTNLQAFLTSPSTNFLICLSSRNFSCSTYRTVIQAFNSQFASMTRERQEAVVSHFIVPFLSRNDSSDPGCVSSTSSSQQWLEINYGNFSELGELQDFQRLNPDFSTEEVLQVLTPSQVADVVVDSLESNDTTIIDDVFDRLQEGNAVENVEEFCTRVTETDLSEDLSPLVRDRVMNRTFDIIGPSLPSFNQSRLMLWFDVLLVPFLPSFTAEMLRNTTTGMNCSNYQVVSRAVGGAASQVSITRQEETFQVLLAYLNNASDVINTPGCRVGIANDSEWLDANLGPFSTYASYSELRVFNLSVDVVLDSLSPAQNAELLLDSNNLLNETLAGLVITTLTTQEELSSFFVTFVRDAAEQNVTSLPPSVRDTILNLTLTGLSPAFNSFAADDFKLWFQDYLPLFLPSTNSNTLEIIPRNITCNSYQEIIKGFDNVFTDLSESQRQEIFAFTIDYLSAQSSSGLSCVESINDDRRWLEDNFGRFRDQASFADFVTLNTNFSGVEVADLLTFNQLTELAATPSQLNGTEAVRTVMAVIDPVDFDDFFDAVSPAIEVQSVNYTQEVKSGFLQEIFERGSLSSPAISDEGFLQWLRLRLRPLLVDLSPMLVTPLFNIGLNRSCNNSQEIIAVLDMLHVTLSNDTQQEVNKNIQLSLQGPVPLRCYSGGSFYVFLTQTFLSFGFPNASELVSLLPPTRESELLSTISTSELGQLLRLPNAVDNTSDLCPIFDNYNDTIAFLLTEDVPDDVRMAILPCVWPVALSSNNRSEACAWFDVRLKDFLPLLTRTLISSTQVQNASCFAFQKFVSVMGNNFTFNSSDLQRSDVYTTIRTYLGAGSQSSEARCFNASDPELNSTAWFVTNIGNFISFASAEDLASFVPATQIQTFLENSANLALFNNTAIPQSVIDYYITQLFESNPSFNILDLPGVLLCSSEIPISVFSSLSEADTVRVSNMLNNFCTTSRNPEVSAALASNIQNVDAETFATLGDSSSGLTSSQLAAVSPEVAVSALSSLGTVNWNQQQASVLVETISQPGSGLEVNSASALVSLGTVVVGVPAQLIESIPPAELLSASSDQAFVSNVLSASAVVQQTFATQIIAADPNPASVVTNIPDALATEIPASLLGSLPENVDISLINQKTWRSDQAAILYPTLGESEFDAEMLSSSLLSGFSCTTAQSLSKERIRQLVQAARPRKNRANVVFEESQLTCMYNLLNGSLSQSFTDYPPGLLLYFNNNDIETENCRSYFAALGAADFSVASPILNRASTLFSQARVCLNINGNLTREQVEDLGSMACTLDSSIIRSANPAILESLQVCSDFSDSQVDAMETLLLSGETQFGQVSSWNRQTLNDLGILPLHLTRNFWDAFPFRTKRRFLRTFLPELRRNGTRKDRLRALFSAVSSVRSRRGAGCTVGNITQITVNDQSFPFGYDVTQFDLCLDVPVLRDNLFTISEKVDDTAFQSIILQRLNQAFPSGVPDQQVRLLQSVSRAASLDDISKWSVTSIDTLSALMNPADGPWEPAMAKEIITMYLSTGNSLGTSELDAIGSNICSLDTATLNTITPDSLRNARPQDITTCSTEQKSILYEIRNSSLSSTRSSSTTYYNLIRNYLGGADLADIRRLSTEGVNMDVNTLTSLAPDVLSNLSVTTVRNLMGSHLQDLRSFENDTVVRSWVNRQLQSDLDELNLGLTSNRSDTTDLITTLPGNTNGGMNTNSTTNGTEAMNPSTSPPNGTPQGVTSPIVIATTSNTTPLKAPAFICLIAALTTLQHLLQYLT
ncbi:unnamed protein product [Ophioblennius macclurei]